MCDGPVMVNDREKRQRSGLRAVEEGGGSHVRSARVELVLRAVASSFAPATPMVLRLVLRVMLPSHTCSPIKVKWSLRLCRVSMRERERMAARVGGGRGRRGIQGQSPQQAQGGVGLEGGGQLLRPGVPASPIWLQCLFVSRLPSHTRSPRRWSSECEDGSR